MIMRLAKYVIVNRFNNQGVFGLGGNQLIYENIEEWEILVALSHTWLKPYTKEDALLITSNNHGITIENLNKAYKTLIDNNFIIDEISYFNPTDRYSRSYLYYALTGNNPYEVQKRLKKSTVVILGCGGIGNYVSYMLASSGIGKLILVDDDTIELTNLTRQFLFTEKDVGSMKIDIIERELRKRNSNIEIEKLPLSIKSIEDISKISTNVDMFVLSADSPVDIIYWMNSYSISSKIPYINIDYFNDISIIGPFVIPGKTACFECAKIAPDFYNKKDFLFKEIKEINNNFKTSTFPAVNGTAASMGVNDIIRYLGELGEPLSVNQRIGIHSLKDKIEHQRIPKNKDCKICGHL